ncbi:phosphoacetylglucosamine mutase [Trichuris trichiura]|uniref:phosphoacetylglucosamine mutase n=1 Tax=Trichuris trichiura TaxID=36087 RepID=A0A077ZI25_TRITR|nr:phosphoacetylglucosamine mutase [Trichuris trichiura]
MDQNSVTLRSAAFLAVRLAVACICSFFTAKLIIKYMDPAYSEKKSARRQVYIAKDYGITPLVPFAGLPAFIPFGNPYNAAASQIVVGDESGASWSDIGGYDDLLAELKETVILPLKLRSSSAFLQPPKGVLLYGPPGCGKTLIARAVAKDAGATFINLEISSLTDKWYGESEKLAAAVFTLAKKIQPAIIFIDEIDSFLRVRESRDHETTAMMKAQFLSNWDGFASDRQCRVVIIGASNRPLDVDPAILRRMPSRFCLNLPVRLKNSVKFYKAAFPIDWPLLTVARLPEVVRILLNIAKSFGGIKDEKQRTKVLEVLLRDEQLHPDVNLDEIAARCQLFSCSDLSELCRLAAVSHVQELLRSGANIDELNDQPFRLADFKTALARMTRDDDFNRCIDVEGALSDGFMKYKDIPSDFRRTSNELLRYGTAGFREKATKLPHVMFRMGILAVLRARQTGGTVGIMITASHNPIGDNGLKMIDPSGEMLVEEWEEKATRFANCPYTAFPSAYEKNPPIQVYFSEQNLEAEIEAIVKEFNINMDAEGTVCCARDTRPSGISLFSIVRAGVEIVRGKFISYEILTTPQLHYIIRETNLENRRWKEDEYFGRLLLAYERLNSDESHYYHFYDPRVFVDCANGVGARKLYNIATEVKMCLEICLANRSAEDCLNEQCGADYVKSEKKVPYIYDASHEILPNVRWASLDGDADRIVFYYIDDNNKFHLLDGDKIAALVANYFKGLIEQTELDLQMGVVQTAYSNGNATRYLKEELRVPVICTPTGVKYLHAAAKSLDIGIYFEPNGHGTVLFSQKAIDAMWRIIERRSKMINQAIGDAICDLLLVETILRNKRWQIHRWDQLYTDIPNKLIKFKVADRRLLRTTDCERRVTHPRGLAEHIAKLLSLYKNSRAVVRPSGTENVVRVYTEADTQEHANQLAVEIQRATVKAMEQAQEVLGRTEPMSTEA